MPTGRHKAELEAKSCILRVDQKLSWLAAFCRRSHLEGEAFTHAKQQRNQLCFLLWEACAQHGHSEETNLANRRTQDKLCST